MNVDFQEKMDPTHRMYLCRMLSVKVLPEDLLERYAQVKRLVDRIDGHLTPGDLAMIIISAGLTSHKETTEGIDARLQAEADEKAVEHPTLDESDDRVIEQSVEQPVEQPVELAKQASVDHVSAEDAAEAEAERAVEQPVSGATEQAAEKPAPQKGAKLWASGMPVKVLQDDEIKQGKIFAVHRGDGKVPVQLTVEFPGGGTVMVNEEDVEAV